MAPRELVIPSDLIGVARAHLQACLPEEGCGLMGGEEFRVERIIPISNAAHRKDRFRMDPGEQVEALASLEADGLDLVAIYHSHPHGPAEPSWIDLSEAAYPDTAYLVFSSPEAGWVARAFQIDRGRANEIEIRMVPEGG